MVAIIIVNFNGFEDTIECVKSILKSDYKDYRIVLVDNGSADADTIKANEFLNNNCHVILSPTNTGFSGGNNLGIKYAKENMKPDYFLLLNNDTIIEAQTLSNLLETTQNMENCGAATGRILYYSAKNVLWSAGGKFDFKTGIADQPALGKANSAVYSGVHETTFCTGCVMMIPYEVIEKVGYLDESYFLYAEDTDYCCRLMNMGYKLYYCGDAIIYHKVSASTGRSSDMSQYYNVRNNFYIIKNYSSMPLYGYAKRWYRMLKLIIRRELTPRNAVIGYRDFKNGVKGRREF